LSYIYSKFGIPDPKQAEATTTRPQSLTPALPFKDSLIVCKDKPGQQRNQQYQRLIDRITEYATIKSTSILADNLAPLMKLLEECSTIEEAAKKLDDSGVVYKLLEKMDSAELQQLLADSMLAANLTGREREHGQ
ncbi:MAG: DUF935 family protein, partial [Angelakisella sp.]